MMVRDMRMLILVIAVAIGCGGAAEDEAKAKERLAAKSALITPRVEVATVLAEEGGQLPSLVIIDDTGAREVTAASWAALDAGALTITRPPGPLALLEGAPADAQEDDSADDDPEYDEEADPDEHSPGPGVYFTIDEGRLMKAREDVRYYMPKRPDDPQRERQREQRERRRAIAQARAATIVGDRTSVGRFVWAPASGQPMPSRVSQVHGLAIDDGNLASLRTLTLIQPTAQATALIDAIRITGGAIAVSHAAKVRPLRLRFPALASTSDSRYWLEVRVQASGVVVEAVPDAPIAVTDLTQLAAALDTARTARGASELAPVDVLVDESVDVQRMIDVVVALDVAGVRRISLGHLPMAEELALRGRRIPTVAFGQPSVNGDLDKSIILRHLKRARPRLVECYSKALHADPELDGWVATQFLVNRDGRVQEASAYGVTQEISRCVAAVIKRLQFPRPQGDGAAHVACQFLMRP